MVIPLGDGQRPRRTPWINRLLLLTNIAVFAFLTPWWDDACAQARFFLEWAAIPAEITQLAPLDSGQVAETVPGDCPTDPIPGKSVPLSVLTAMFLHGGWLHLLSNMLFLGVFGGTLEDRLGRLRYLGFYLVVGIVATLVFVLADPSGTQPLVGASGAIAGVLGAYFRLFPRGWVTVSIPALFFLVLRLPTILVLGGWFALELVNLQVGSLTGGHVATLAHVAGFIAGLVIVGLFRPRGRRRRRTRRSP
ncbi:rhomboid family intramembrane serine protease [Egibacter rhizosphaerae]|uniref:Rhomboid family intramembrane serine protease n=1 Tax=Egibacter rhizosphaerae TaxID=1670831 RepID=A0A411YK75_9ACTN|nr:rhomboid family intramembrane serine protease [Egibacter rhizosphaerae]QBI21580.1 rhomboid family intramembrane serine protease [Egibacter rhizosphaerae]